MRSHALGCLCRLDASGSHVTQELDETLFAVLEGEPPDPMAQAYASARAAALHRCLGQLDHRQREVTSAAYLRDLSHRELAAQLQRPLDTVETWIRRGLKQLRGSLAHLA